MIRAVAAVLAFVLTLTAVGSAIAQKAGYAPAENGSASSDTSDTSDTGGPVSPPMDKKARLYPPEPVSSPVPSMPPAPPVPPEKLSPPAPPFPMPPAPLSLPAKWPSGLVSIQWVYLGYFGTGWYTDVSWELELGPMVPIEYRVIFNGGAFIFSYPPGSSPGRGGVAIDQMLTGYRLACFADVVPVFADGSTPFSFRSNRLC